MERGARGLRLRIGFVLDVARYGARGMPERMEVERRLRHLVTGMLAGCGLRLGAASMDYQWTGDGISAILPADIDPTIAIPTLIRSLAAGLARDNARHPDRIRLRMGIGLGLIEPSAVGYSGPLIVDISRLVDATALRGALDGSPGTDLAIAISSQLYSLVIQPGYPGIPAGQFTTVRVTAKEFTAPAWIWMSDRQWSEPAYPPLTDSDPRQAGRYRIVARLGGPAVGQVYLGTGPRAEENQNWTAVKVLGNDLAVDRQARRRLATGVLAARVLAMENLAAITGADTRASRPWVARTLTRGPSLAETITETGPLPADVTGWLALGLARAITTVHEARLAHHAITPGNVLLDADRPVLTDLGTSRTALSSLPGTAAADIRQFAVTTCYAATGRYPWHDSPGGPFPPEVTDGEPDLTGCPPALTPLLRACLDADPAARPTAPQAHTRLADLTGRHPRPPLPDPVLARIAEYRALPPVR